MSASAARVWITTGLPSSAASASCASKSSLLPVARRVVAVVVEAGLADGDRRSCREQLAQLVEAAGLVAAGLVRVDAERGEDAFLSLGDVERGAHESMPEPDRDDAVDAGLARAGDDVRGLLCERIEVRMRVDHAAAAAASMRASSSPRPSPGRASGRAASARAASVRAASSLGAQAPTQLA